MAANARSAIALVLTVAALGCTQGQAQQLVVQAINESHGVVVVVGGSGLSGGPLQLRVAWSDVILGVRPPQPLVPLMEPVANSLLEPRLAFTVPNGTTLPLCGPDAWPCIPHSVGLEATDLGITSVLVDPDFVLPAITISALTSTESQVVLSVITPRSAQSIKVVVSYLGRRGSGDLSLDAVRTDSRSVAGTQVRDTAPLSTELFVFGGLSPYSWCLVEVVVTTVDGTWLTTIDAVRTQEAAIPGSIVNTLLLPRPTRLVYWGTPTLPWKSFVGGVEMEFSDTFAGDVTRVNYDRSSGLLGLIVPSLQYSPWVFALTWVGVPFTVYSVRARMYNFDASRNRVFGPWSTPSSTKTLAAVQPPLVLHAELTNSSVLRIFWLPQRPFGDIFEYSVTIHSSSNSTTNELTCAAPCSQVFVQTDLVDSRSLSTAQAVVRNSAGTSEPSNVVSLIVPKGASSSSTSVTGIVVGTLLGGLLLLLILVWLYIRRARKRDQMYLPPAPDEWEVPRDRLTMQQELGKGAFGKVFQADLQTPTQEEPRAVAVKTCNLIDRDQLSDFLRELELMKTLSKGAHPNVILLLGVCTQERPLYGIMELADLGDLLSFVRKQPGIIVDKHAPKLAFGIASGMAYLFETHSYIHRDLAARNILLVSGENGAPVAKVGDFGRARELTTRRLYQMTGAQRLPVRWMAPETMIKGTFHSSSDVFSYAVVIWEMYSQGQCPFPLLSDEQVAEKVCQGLRLIPPRNTPPGIAALMALCFNSSPSSRPSFEFIVQQFSISPVAEQLAAAVRSSTTSSLTNLMRSAPASPGDRTRNDTSPADGFAVNATKLGAVHEV